MVSTVSSDARSFPTARTQPVVRRLSSDDLGWALSEGWRDFREKRGDLLLAGVLYPAICFVAAMVTLNGPLLPLFFPLVAGVSIAGPAVAAGFYELARRREEGRDSTWWHFLDPFRDRRRGALLALTGMLAVLFGGWLLAAYVIYGAIMGPGVQPLTVPPIPAFVEQVLTTPKGWALIVVGNLVGLAFAVVTLAVSVASFPMAVDQPVEAGAAIGASVAVARANPRVMIGWGLRVAALLALGALPFGIGLAIVLPWLGYATWHLYTRAVER